MMDMDEGAEGGIGINDVTIVLLKRFPWLDMK